MSSYPTSSPIGAVPGPASLWRDTDTGSTAVAVEVEWLLARLDERSAPGLADGLERLIIAEVLPAGSRLPTIRVLAEALGVSARSVVWAWRRLADRGFVHTRGRAGTFVGARAAVPAEPQFSGWRALDFTWGQADARLQPDLLPAFADALTDPTINSVGRVPITNALRSALVDSWPFTPESWITVGAIGEAIFLAVGASAPAGATIAVAEPLPPGVRESLRTLAVSPIPVSTDHDGPIIDDLRLALQNGAEAFVFQPGSPFSPHPPVTAARLADLAKLLGGSQRPVSIIEIEPFGPLLETEPLSLGEAFPARILRVQAYCRAFGLDLKTSVIAGSAELVRGVREHRARGLGSNSRILQNALAYLLTDSQTQRDIAVARRTYDRRRERLLAALRQRGVQAGAGSASAIIWVAVRNEIDALTTLASRGIVAASGSALLVEPRADTWITIATLQLPDAAELIDELADAVAAASLYSPYDDLA